MAVDVRIERIVAGGDGLGRHEGRVVFVAATAPGELHRVEVVAQKKDYARGRSVSCREPSERRRAAPCPYYEACGGCSLMHLQPDAQLEAKTQILLECLERGGAIAPDGLPTVEVRSSPETEYRTRLRFHIDRRSMGFRRRKSHDVEDVKRCILGTEGLNETWHRCRQWMEANPDVTRALLAIEIQEGSGRFMARFVVRSIHGRHNPRPRFDRRSARAVLDATGLDGCIVETERGEGLFRAGRPWVEHEVARFRLQQSGGSFFQTNRHLLDALVEAARPERRVRRLVDLYCGVGFLALPLSTHASEVVGVEASKNALRDAEANAKAAGLEHVRFVLEDAGAFARRWRFQEDDYVVVDPPRAGLARHARDALASSPIRTLCYISCDPAAFARDAGYLVSRGFRVDRLELFDLFPNTHHFETVARLSR